MPEADVFSEELVWNALKQCFDPEIPLNIVDLGLIYDLKLLDGSATGKHKVQVQMTLTAQGCGMGPVIAEDAKTQIEKFLKWKVQRFLLCGSHLGHRT